MRRYTYEEVKKIFENIGYKLLSESYKNTTTHIRIECDKGHISEYYIFKNFLSGSRCLECSGKKPYTIEQVQKIFDDRECKLLNTEYNNIKSQLKYQCKCGNISSIFLNDFKVRIYLCDKCSKKPHHYTTETFIERCQTLYGDKYDYSLVDYKDKNVKVKIICREHGEFEQTPGNHIVSNGCKPCSTQIKRKAHQFDKNRFIVNSQKVHGETYNYDKVDYINNSTKVLITCNKHGDFLQTPDKHWSGQGCLKCKSSKGENIIRTYLQNNSIKFIEQYTFPKQKYHTYKYFYKCKYDFYLPDKNTVIEYQGEQHYKFSKHIHGTIDKFNHRIFLDNIKKNFCIDHDINFIEIKYNENIISILNELPSYK